MKPKSKRHLRLYGGLAAAVLFVCLGAGCPGPATQNGSRKVATERRQDSSQKQGQLCVVDVSKVMTEARSCPQFKKVWEAIKEQKKRLQAELNFLVKAYRRTYELDLKAAKYIKVLKKIQKEKGAVLSDKQYKEKVAVLQRELDADPKLATAVKEQMEESAAYKNRKAAALKQARTIAKKGKELQAKLEQKAREIAAPVTKKIQAAVSQALKNQLGRRCHVLCDSISRKVVGHQGSVDQARKQCEGPFSRGKHDATEEILQEVIEALRDTTRAPRKTAPAPVSR